VASSAARIAATSLRADEAVSVCTIKTAAISRSPSARSRASTVAGSIASPAGATSSSTCRPSKRAISAHVRPNPPHSRTSTRSPRDNVLDIAIAQAPWPLLAVTNARLVVPAMPGSRS
jgi:hypothetical protein